jgi:hypothetical protein
MRCMSPALAFPFAVILCSLSLAAEPGERVFKPTGPVGPCSVAQWKADWPGCEWQDGVKEGHLSIAEREGKRVFRVDYAAGQIGPEKCGVGWRQPLGTLEAAQLTYTVRFGKDFDWVKGGKLPGLSGGPENVSGGRPANGSNGFSARLMWRADGRGEAYVYHKNQPENYGDRFAFPTDFRFPTETPIRVRLRVAMNEPGRRNGKLYVWIAMGDDLKAERLVVSRTDLEWRTVPSFGVDSLYFETFHGGNDQSWAPSRACWAEFSGVKVVAGE